MKTTPIEITGQPILQITYEDLKKIIDLNSGDRMVSRETASKLIDVSPQTIDELRRRKLINKYYIKDPSAVKPLSRYRYSELVLGLWCLNKVL